MILHAYTRFFECSGTGVRTVGPPRPPVGSTWTANDYLNLRALLRALFDIISSSGRSPEELFLCSGNSPASGRPTVRL